MDGAETRSQTHYLEAELRERLGSDPAILDIMERDLFDGIWYWDLENPENEWMSPAFWRALGFDPATKKHLASEWKDLIHPEDYKVAATNFEAHIADPSHPYDQLVRYTSATGETVCVRCRGVAIRDRNGKPIRLLGAHAAVTDLIKLTGDHELRRTSSILENVLNTATSGVIGLDREGVIHSINPAARHMLGGVSETTPLEWPSAIKFLDGEYFHPLDASASPINRAIAGQELKQEIHLVSRAQGLEHRYVRISSASIDNDGAPVSCVIVMDDVSDQEKNRQQIERRGRLDALGQLTGGIAHDFNNLLATVQYAMSLLGDETLSERGRGYLSIIQDSISRGTDLTSRLLAFAKRQSGVVKTHRTLEVLEDFRGLVRPAIEESIDLEFVAEEEELRVHCDRPQLESALLNLVLNSRDAIVRSGKGSSIRIASRGLWSVEHDVTLAGERALTHIATDQLPEETETHSYRYVEFSVSDDGPGMSEEVKSRAVDPFFTTKSSQTGTGLGLSMVYGFVRQSEGVLRIYSEVGGGTTVRIILPRGDDNDLREAPKAKPKVEPGRGERILVAEDDPLLQVVVEDVIRAIGYDVILASSGREALDLIRDGMPFDLLLTDIVMPGGIGGFELARLARQANENIPILYMSGYAGLTEQDMGDVVAPMVRKPCQPDELATAIKNALAGKDGD